jgi:hypothetical protein
MKLSPTEIAFLALMLAAGVAIGFVQRAHPAFGAFFFPPFAWPLAVSLAFDLVTIPMIRDGRIAPLSAGIRAAGVVAAGLLVIVVAGTATAAG